MKRLTKLGGIAAGVVGGLVAVAWLMKDRISGPQPAPAGSDETPRFQVAPPPSAAPAPEPTTASDDLSEIKGVGPVYRARLDAAGIHTFGDLGEADAAKLAGEIEVPVSRVQAWIDAARRRS